MRRTKDVIITAEGRDKGKVFRITEMSATAGEEWALRAINAAIRGGAKVPDGFQGVGMAALAVLGVKACLGMPWLDLKPLLDEMMACVTFVPPNMPTGRFMQADDIEEIATRLQLRQEVFELHTGFFTLAARLKQALSQVFKEAASSGTSTSSTSPDSSPES